MQLITLISLPASALALIGVLFSLMKLGRSMGKKEMVLAEHDRLINEQKKMLKSFQDKSLVTFEGCRKNQIACVSQQKEANARILKEIAELKEDVRRNRSELKSEAEAERKAVHDMLMKMTEKLGNIDGAIGYGRIQKGGVK